jgi:hypothetical protein
MKTITEMTRELGGFAPTTKFLERFAELVRAEEQAEEREACAKLVHDNALACDPGSMLQTYLASNAAAIRARGNT